MIRNALLSLCLAAAPLSAIAEGPLPPSRVDYAGFAALTTDLAAARAQRLISLDRFWAMAADKGTLILDALSRDPSGRGHIDGAVNLPFTAFPAASLAQLIGDPNRRLLIYCNNNFVNNTDPVVTKKP